ncbi:MAG: hypothetical protein PHD31_01605 [Candidatus Pacebacteria bacterium]|nr:hypothetical protein [Candidatus Paceibacterota bacterium]
MKKILIVALCIIVVATLAVSGCIDNSQTVAKDNGAAVHQQPTPSPTNNNGGNDVNKDFYNSTKHYR